MLKSHKLLFIFYLLIYRTVIEKKFIQSRDVNRVIIIILITDSITLFFYININNPKIIYMNIYYVMIKSMDKMNNNHYNYEVYLEENELNLNSKK